MKINIESAQKAIYQLEDLIRDRKSFLDGDEEHDEVFKADIEALRYAINKLTKNTYV